MIFSSVTVSSDEMPFMVNSDCGNHVKSWNLEVLVRSEPYVTVWVDKITAPHCQITGEIICPGMFELQYVVNVQCLEFCSCKKWPKELTLIENSVVTANETARNELSKGLSTEEKL